jgi:hypothetical protein
LEYSVSELEGKVEELQCKRVVCQNSKLKIQEGVRERREGLITSMDFTISGVGSFLGIIGYKNQQDQAMGY